MREIKFRAWDKVNNNYYYNVQDIHDNIVADSFGNILENEEFVVEQYTGNKDVNGVEIYEGDIVVPYESQELSERQTIIFDRFGFSQHSEIVGNTLLGMLNYELIVIGNIHEQSELLEDK